MKYKILVEYEVEFNTSPENLSMAIDDAVQIRDDVKQLRNLEGIGWKATVVFLGKTFKEV